MSQENVEVVRRAFDAYERQGIEAILPYCDPSIRWRNPAHSPIANVFDGHEGVLEWYRQASEFLGPMQFEPQRFIEASNNRVVVISRMRVTGQQSGLEMETPFTHVVTLERGKAVEVEMYTDVQEALEAAGLRE